MGRISALLELGAGFHPELTGRENIYLNAAILGLSRKQTDGLYDEHRRVLRARGVHRQPGEALLERHVRAPRLLGGGQRRPDILLIDEVIAVGDEEFQAKCLDKISDFQDSGKTIVLVTHSADLAAQVSNRILSLEYGKMKMLGDPAEVVSEDHRSHARPPPGRGFRHPPDPLYRSQADGRRGADQAGLRDGEGMKVRLSTRPSSPSTTPFSASASTITRGDRHGTNTRLRDLPIPRVEKPGVVEFCIPRLSLLDGRYYLSVASCTRDYKTDYHWMDKFFYFDVKSPGMDAGYLSMDCDITWHET